MALTITMGSKSYGVWEKYMMEKKSTCVHCGDKIVKYPWEDNYHHTGGHNRRHKAVPATEENIIDRILNKYGE